VTLVRDGPPAVHLAETDGQTEAVVGILLERLDGPATEQGLREGDFISGGDVKRDAVGARLARAIAEVRTAPNRSCPQEPSAT
jgi:hypothetical protein